MEAKAAPSVHWGRKTAAEIGNSLGGLAIIVSAPWLTIINWIALEYYNGSLTAALSAALRHGPARFTWRYFPQASAAAAIGYVAWLLFQALLYTFLPGARVHGQRTPGGYLLGYTTNGLAAWLVSHGAFVLAWTLGYVDPALIARNWQGLIIVANCYGVLLTTVALLKGYYAPSHPEDRKFSGSFIFDFWAGIELNPRFGSDWDWKWFHNSRPSIVAWTLIDISFAAYQYQLHGYITKSMLIVILLHGIYVLDLFWNEAWYTRTPDISHDHFGFYLAWGDSVWLPTFYTLQAQYLARYPSHLTNNQTWAVIAVGLLGYFIFRAANYQRDAFRSSAGTMLVWGRPAKYIECEYSTTDGKTHRALLLASGWWGSARHVNYLGDMILAAAMCAACGTKHILPWGYFFYLTALLIHRMDRNDSRCKNKYGAKWDEYCRAVPWKLIPGVY